MVERQDPLAAAKQFIDKHFSNCQGALLAGSVVRGEATETSDLDIVIFDKRLTSSVSPKYKKSAPFGPHHKQP